jgi:glycosyltransferase involved in cell wall biosynthesis
MAASTHALLRAALATPDDRVGWVPFGVLAGLRLLSSKGVDAILSTAPPFSSHLIGLALHRLSGLPWVAEFRDPWVENPWHEDWSRVERVANQLLERRVVSRADAVIVTCEQARDQLLASYPDLPADRFHVIPNGFDPEWYALSGTCAASVKTGGGFCLVHCGALYGERDPRPFLTALAAARAHGLDVRFRQAGPAGSFGGLTLAELTAANGLTGYVHHIHRITHRDSLRLQRRADALVLFQSNAPAQVPSKLYEYLGWQKPVLALISNSAATYEVARASGLCMIADARAPAEIELALAGLVRNGATRLLPNLDYLSQFAEPSPSGLLAACLEAVLHGGAHLGAAVRSGPAKTAGEDASGLQLRMQRCNSQLNQTQEAVVPGSPPAVCARRGLCDES